MDEAPESTGAYGETDKEDEYEMKQDDPKYEYLSWVR